MVNLTEFPWKAVWIRRFVSALNSSTTWWIRDFSVYCLVCSLNERYVNGNYKKFSNLVKVLWDCLHSSNANWDTEHFDSAEVKPHPWCAGLFTIQGDSIVDLCLNQQKLFFGDKQNSMCLLSKHLIFSCTWNLCNAAEKHLNVHWNIACHPGPRGYSRTQTTTWSNNRE